MLPMRAMHTGMPDKKGIRLSEKKMMANFYFFNKIFLCNQNDAVMECPFCVLPGFVPV